MPCQLTREGEEQKYVVPFDSHYSLSCSLELKVTHFNSCLLWSFPNIKKKMKNACPSTFYGNDWQYWLPRSTMIRHLDKEILLLSVVCGPLSPSFSPRKCSIPSSHLSLSTQVSSFHLSYSPVVLFVTQQPNNVLEKMWFSLWKMCCQKKSIIDVSVTDCFILYFLYFCVYPNEISRKTLYPLKALLTLNQPKSL